MHILSSLKMMSSGRGRWTCGHSSIKYPELAQQQRNSGPQGPVHALSPYHHHPGESLPEGTLGLLLYLFR